MVKRHAGAVMGEGGLPLMELKTVTEVRELGEDGRTVTGFPSVFGNVDDSGDVIEPGAYVKTIAERGERMRWLWQHDKTQPPIARVLEIGEVGREGLPAALVARFPEATGALRVQREYLDTPRGNEVLAAIRSGALTEMSIGYDAIKADVPPESIVAGRKVRRALKEIRLWEMSDVNWGMNAATANVKALLAAGDTKGLAQWIESRIHLDFTTIADDLFGDGYLTREERMALSNAIGNALNAFNQRMLGDDLAGVRERARWEPVEEDEEEDTAPARAIQVAELRRRVQVLQKQLALV
jgi:HK97 family phage prohead protease